VVFYLELIVQELNSWLIPRYGDDTLELDFDLDEIPAMSLRRQQLFERASAAGFLTPNEKRALVGYSPVEGGDTLLVETTLTTLELTLDPPKPEPKVVAAPGAAASAIKKPTPKPKKSFDDQATLTPTLKATREALDLTVPQFALWLEGEGWDEDKARELAAWTEDEDDGNDVE
jgi:hypothetical protein